MKISAEHLHKINQAVRCAFNESEVAIIRQLSGGLSGAAVYQIKVQEALYVVKMADEQVADAARTFEIIKLASNLGICPKVYYADANSNLLLMANIHSVPAEKSPENIRKLATLIRTLHEQKFTKSWKSVVEVLTENYQRFPDSYKQVAIIQECLAEIQKFQLELFNADDLRLCHADLNPANVLFDGEQWYFVDWQAASVQSFYYDLACVATWFYFYDESLCELLLTDYLDRAATESEKAKYNLMRVFTQVYFGVGFIAMPLKMKADFPLLRDEDIDKLPDFAAFLSAVGRGQVNLAEMAEQQKFGFTFFRKAKSMMNEYTRRAIDFGLLGDVIFRSGDF